MVEDPGVGHVLRRDLEIFLLIKKPADLILFPFNGIDVEIILERIARHNQIRANAIATRIPRRVDGSINGIRFPADVFENIDLT